MYTHTHTFTFTHIFLHSYKCSHTCVKYTHTHMFTYTHSHIHSHTTSFPLSLSLSPPYPSRPCSVFTLPASQCPALSCTSVRTRAHTHAHSVTEAVTPPPPSPWVTDSHCGGGAELSIRGEEANSPVAGGGLGRPGLGPEPHFHCCLPHPLLLLPAPRAARGQEPSAGGRLRHLELHCCPSRRTGIGIGFYGNSETSDGVSQLSSALLHANHTLTAIDHLAHPCAQVLEMVERLDEAVRTELTTLEEVLTQRTELVAATRGARRQAEAVAQQLQGLAFWQGVPLSPVQVAEDVSFVEEYRWLAYVLLLLLELLVCLFTLLGLAKQSKWLVIVMTVMSLLVLVLSWGSMGLEAATAVGLSDFCSSPDTYILNLTREETGLGSDILNYYFLCNQAVSNPFQQRLTLSQRALANIHSQLQGLEREAVPQFPSAQKPLLSLEETLNVTEGNFHQLVALLHCRGLHKDYGAALRGLCEDALEGLLYLLLFSLLSAGALATALCSLPRAWALFPPRNPSASCSGSHLSEPFLHARLEPVPHLRSFPSCRRRPH
ncbi:protein tweety homolog 1 isoform X3 [Sagmatias obliquidens]|uniref:protein tweety homolog 1 isoform X3 n=1 Tax=Sagmatias obliquidens TaxID=3371155 RepID=UPI000F43F503|nr:protein tweety homolog 1 isoform X3 [Lagenorhynchus obliquidens]